MFARSLPRLPTALGGLSGIVAHVGIDDHTRLACAEVLPDERAETAVAFFRRAVAWYRARDITVERVMTENGNAYA